MDFAKGDEILSSNNDFEKPERQILDLDIAARTAMLFGLGMSKADAYNALGVPYLQSDEWEELWDGLRKEELWKILTGHLELEEDKFFVKRSLYRLKSTSEPEVWSDGGWKSSQFLVEALEARNPGLQSIDFEDAIDCYPEAFADGAEITAVDSELSKVSDPNLTNGVGISLQEFLERESQRNRKLQQEVLEVVAGVADSDQAIYFECLTLFRLRPSFETEILSQGAWQNHSALLIELREGKLPESFDREAAEAMFPDAF